jgi:hypothetical protein
VAAFFFFLGYWERGGMHCVEFGDAAAMCFFCDLLLCIMMF